jgi:hypothetical protein
MLLRELIGALADLQGRIDRCPAQDGRGNGIETPENANSFTRSFTRNYTSV